MLRALRLAWAACLCGFLLLLGIYYARRVDPRESALYARDVRRLQALHAELETDVLQLRSELLLHYDPPNATIDELFRLHRALSRPPSFLSPAGRAELGERVAESLHLLEEIEGRFEQFKQLNAQLRNSMRYTPAAAAKITDRPGNGEAAAAVQRLLRDLLVYELFPEEGYRTRVESGLGHARAALAADQGDDRTADEALFRHVATILRKKPLVEDMTERLVDPRALRLTEELDDAWARHHEAALDVAQTRRSWIFVLALATLALAASEVIGRQRRAEAQLRKLARKLKRANRDLRREKAREQELNELKSRFVSMTSHEFRTPLSVIRSSAELLERYGNKWDEEKRAKHLGRIQGSVMEMTKLLEGVLLLGRVESGRLPCEPREMPLAPFCADIVAAVRETYPTAPPIRTALSGAASAPLDERILRHVVTNLLTNAVKYSKADGAIDLEVAKSNGEVVFRVRDQGIGIPEADIPHLFDSFHRCSNVGDVPGTGLGLALCKRLVERHDGHIDVDSREGEGTTFVVTVPVGEEERGKQ